MDLLHQDLRCIEMLNYWLLSRHETTIVEIAGNVEDIDMVVPYDEWSILQYTYKLSGIAYDHHKTTIRAITDKTLNNPRPEYRWGCGSRAL